MKKTKNRWAFRTAGKNFTLMEVMTVICVLVMLVAMVSPALTRARERGRKTACANNLRQLGAAATQYWQDHTFLPRPERFLDNLSPFYKYLRNYDAFRCPSSPRKDFKKSPETLIGGTDYLYWSGRLYSKYVTVTTTHTDESSSSSSNGNGHGNGHGHGHGNHGHHYGHLKNAQHYGYGGWTVVSESESDDTGGSMTLTQVCPACGGTGRKGNGHGHGYGNWCRKCGGSGTLTVTITTTTDSDSWSVTTTELAKGETGPYGIDYSNAKFQRVKAEKTRKPVLYDRIGPAHLGTINICHIDDGRVESKADMCNLWTIDANGKLVLDSTTPFPVCNNVP